MGVSDKIWDALATVIKMNDRIVSLSKTIENQQTKIENLTERVIRLETTIELLMRDQKLVKMRLAAVADFPVLRLNQEIYQLAQQYFAAVNIPEKSKIDAFHLAVAAWYGMDYVLSWNCKHIASGRVQKILQALNAKAGRHTPIMCTPEELMEVQDVGRSDRGRSASSAFGNRARM